MSNWINIYLASLLIDVVIALILSVYAWRHRKVSGAAGFSFLLLLVALWNAASILTLISPTAASADVWEGPVKAIAYTVTPVALLRFILEYTENTYWLKPKRFAVLLIVPIAINLVNFVRPDWFIADRTYVQVNGLWFLDEGKEQPLFWLHVVYSYLLIMSSYTILIVRVFRMRGFYRRQAITFLIGALVTFTGNIIAIASYQGEFGLDFTVITFTIGGLLWAWALFRHQLLPLMPIAHEAIVRSMEDAIFVLNTENRVVDLNPAGEELLSRQSHQVIGQPVEVVFARQTDLVKNYLNVKNTQEEVRVTGRDNKPRYFDMYISTLHRRAGQEGGRLLVLRDITARKQAELEREQLIEDLDAYAHTVAHDLKSPLSILIGYTSLIRDKSYASVTDLESHLETVDESAHRMVRIIDELLLFASLREMDQVPTETLNMPDLIERALKRLTHLIQHSDASLTIAESFPQALGYGPWVEEIWANYISNALKYGGDPPIFTIGADTTGDHIRFWVKDNGRGLTPEEQGSLFVKFARLDAPRAEGHGLGLSIVQRITNKLGGTVGVESEPGKGSTFYFTLPSAS